jgi:MFS family permease
MQDTAGTWLMTTLSASPLLIALMQTAASLPVLLLGFPAGGAADIFDRRRLLLFWQSWMLGAAVLLSLLSLTGSIVPWSLLGLTFLLNIGTAVNNPAWQAIIPELVPRSEVPDAVSLNSAGYNLARAVGPALGGVIVAGFALASRGAGLVFLFNALSFVAVIFVLYQWRRLPPKKSALPAERLFGSLRSGSRYIRHSPLLRAILARAFVFTVFVSAVWALLAVVAHQDLHQGAMGYSILNGCLGGGAVLGAAALPKLRRRVAADALASSAPVICVATLLTLAWARSVPMVVVSLIACGFAWTTTTATMNIAVQISVPSWVQARALGMYQTIFWGGMALGSAWWGLLAKHFTVPKSLLCAAIGLLLSLPLTRGLHMLPGTVPDLSPFELNRAAPQIAIAPHPEAGPVLITIEYRIRAEDYDEFTRGIHILRGVRMRDGAIRWGVFQDAAYPERFVETFVVESWLEFLRERERMTVSDRYLRDRIWSLNQGNSQPVVSYMVYAKENAL